MKPLVTVVSVAYNSESVLPDMQASLPHGTPLVVVDNGSKHPEGIAKAVQGAHVIRNDANEGFGRACNKGAAAADTEFLLFLNPDARIASGTLEAFVASARAFPNAAAWNPRFLDKDGNQTFRRRSKIAAKDTATALPLPDADCEISTLMGSAIFLRKSQFDAIQGFDPAIFLYHEDDDLALRLIKRGPLMRCFGAEVTHLEGRGSPRTPDIAYLKAFHMARSRSYAYAKHGHSGTGAKTVLRGTVGVLSPLNLFSARKRAKSLGFLKGAISALRDGGIYRG